MDTEGPKIKDANNRSVTVISLLRLQKLLMGELTFDSLGQMEKLNRESFKGDAYVPAATVSQAASQANPIINATDAGAAATAVTQNAASSLAPPNEPTAPSTQVPTAPPIQAPTALSLPSLPPSIAPPVQNAQASTAPPLFSILVLGSNGAVNSKILRGKAFVMTGLFEEVDANEATANAAIKAMLESFGGKVNKNLSKNTGMYCISIFH